MHTVKKLWAGIGVFLFIFLPLQGVTRAQAPSSDDTPNVYMFGRDTCGFCKQQKEFLNAEGIAYTYLNIETDAEAKALYDQITQKHGLAKVTPVTVIGERVLVGFNGPRTTGVEIKAAIVAAKEGSIRTLDDHLVNAPVQQVASEGGCSGIACDMGSGGNDFVFDLPILGVVDLRSFSLFSLSLILGVIDGFNPCAMWVLITFIVLLSQAGSRKKMIFLAGLFILAQGVMYNLILNVWYKTWDFVELDAIVTPLVGVLALGGGAFFLWRWRKNRDASLVCDISDVESQTKLVEKFKKLAQQPVTLASVFAILVIAFSVNIIEFACSIGIPQAYTKILELNALSFFERQWYIFIFSIGYMIDDVIVFGLAIWGYGKLQAHGGKYAQASLLIGGVLMFLLGALLVFNPGLLVI